MKSDDLLLYAVTDRAWLNGRTLYSQVEDSLKGGVTIVQLREKELGYDEFLNEALEIGALCRKYNVPFIVNDEVEIAIKSGADGVHIGQDDADAKKVRKAIGDRILGVSVQTVEQAIKAVNDGADYLGVGAVFSTSTKLDACDVPYDVLYDICNAVDIPVVAIGGINNGNILQLRGSGIRGVALVSAIYAAGDIESECRILRELAADVVG